jgi:N-acetylmuramoyl-L-alanine amidase
MKVTGKVSHFGGPQDMGVSPSEDLAFWEEYSQVADPEELLLPKQPPNTTGLARRLDPAKFYIACRWDYDQYSKKELASGDDWALVRAPKTGRKFLARPADWGPHENTGRVADISPGLMAALGIVTDDTVEVTYPSTGEEPIMSIHRVAISAGHGKKVAGAAGVDGLQENVETPKVMRAVAEALRRQGVTVVEYWDETSTTQQQNLDAIVRWHNKQTRDLDVSIHFNASTGQGHGTEVLYVSQEELAFQVADAIATCGLTDRGGKKNTGLAFLNGTDGPAILVEVLFIDNKGDADIYKKKFQTICDAIAAGITGLPMEAQPPQPGPSPEAKQVVVALTVPDGVEIRLVVNGELVLIGDQDD